MSDLVYVGNKTLYLVLILVLWPVLVATVVGLLVGLLQTVTQLQEATLPFGLKLLAVSLCLFFLSGWYGEVLINFGEEVIRLGLR